jgi:hypothetical protein
MGDVLVMSDVSLFCFFLVNMNEEKMCLCLFIWRNIILQDEFGCCMVIMVWIKIIEWARNYNNL